MFVIRNIVNLANRIGIKRESDLLMRENGRITLEFRNITDVFDSTTIISEVKKVQTSKKMSFLRGVFIGCGILSKPPSYHLELRFENPLELSFTSSLLAESHIKCHSDEGRIFIKGRENVKRFLFEIGATESYLKLEEDAVIKDVSNKANRKANFEFANLERQTNSSSKQIEIIEYLKGKGKIDDLRDDLREIALLRLNYPFIPLSGLAKKTHGRYSKQSIYYRLKKIEDAYTK
jgi:DNA-binding protein WhiA